LTTRYDQQAYSEASYSLGSNVVLFDGLPDFALNGSIPFEGPKESEPTLFEALAFFLALFVNPACAISIS
jgi:hypothetical protein